MKLIVIFILAYIVTIYFRKKLIIKFSQSEKLIYYQLAVILTIIGAFIVSLVASLIETFVFNVHGLGNGIAIISIIYFLFSMPKLCVNENGRYFLKTNDNT